MITIMREHFFNHPQELGSHKAHKTRRSNAVVSIAMALFALLLLPQGVRGQGAQFDPPEHVTSCGIFIGKYIWDPDTKQYVGDGVQVTTANASNITHNNYIQGKVSFEYDSQTQIRTLTLEDATITGCIYCHYNLNIILKGKNTITAADSSTVLCTSVTNSKELTFKGSGSLWMTGNVNPCIYNFNDTYNDGLNHLETSNGQMAFIYSQIFSGGSGSSDAPYLITTPTDLKDLSTYVNTGLLNTKDINFSVENDLYCSGLTGFTPIGSNTHPFIGNFIGNNKIISELSYTDGQYANTGLFGVIGEYKGDGRVNSYVGGSVDHVILQNCTFGGGEHNGAVTGYLLMGSIYECKAISCTIYSGSESSAQTGSVSVLSGGITSGGIAGTINNGMIFGTVVDCTITASSTSSGTTSTTAAPAAGGIVGCMIDGQVTNGLVSGNTMVSSTAQNGSTAYAGAIVGNRVGGTFGADSYRSEYSSTVITESKTTSGTITKSDQTQRAIGDGDDILGEAHLYTNKVHIECGANGGFGPKNGTYYMYDDGICYVAPHYDFTLEAYPNDGYKPKMNLSDESITFTEEDINVDGHYSHTEFTFSMPNAEVTATLAFAIDISSNNFTATIDESTYSATESLVPNKITLTDATTGGSSILNIGTDFIITGYTLDGTPVDSPIKAGTYIITIEGQGEYTGFISNISYVINKATITPVVTINGWTYGSYNATDNAPSVTEVSNPGNGAVTYKYKKKDAADEAYVAKVPTDVGDYTVQATVAESDNYLGATATSDFTISKADGSLTVPTAIEGLVYNGSEQALVNAGSSSTGMLKYNMTAADATDYSETVPTGIEAKTYTIYYKVEGDANHNDIAPTSLTVTIAKAAGSISYATASIGKTYGDAAFTNEVTITGDGTVTYSSSNTEVATVDATTGEVTIKGNGEATITATAADGTNYTYATKTANYLLSVGTAAMEVSASGYDGTYDGQAHGITVTAPDGATVTYGTTEGTYDLTDAPTYTDAGTYTVYYQVTKPNYTTVNGNQTVTIAKAAGSISYATASIGKTYGDAAFTNEVTITGDGTVTYSSSNTEVATVDATTGEVTIKGNGEATITATAADGTNYTYATKTANYLLSVGTAAMEVSASGYDGTYDGQAHGITVTAPDGATVTYGTTEGTYDLTDAPTYTDAGTYTVYYQVTKPNYTTVNGSQIVTISQVADNISYEYETANSSINKIVGDATFSNTLVITGDGTVTYTSSNTDVATVDATTGLVTIVGNGVTIITATINDGTNYTYTTKTVSYTLTVHRAQGDGYGLWIGDTQVTNENKSDVLNNSSFFFDPSKNMLVITGNQEALAIESRLANLKIFLNDASQLERIYYNNLGNEQNTGTLEFTAYKNIPGKVMLSTAHDDGVISGFSSLALDKSSLIYLLDPIDGIYEGGKLLTETGGEKACTATIGQYIKPLVNNQLVTFNPEDFTITDEEGNPCIDELSNYVANDILYTLKPENDGEGYDSDDLSINLLSTITDEQADHVAKDVENDEYIPGGETYAQNFAGGITFMVPDGEGTIKIDLQTIGNYAFHLKIGTAEPVVITNTERGIVTVPYNVTKPTYVYLYLVETASGARGIISRVGKRERAHGSIYSVQVTPKKSSSSNPLSEIDNFPESDIPEIIFSDETPETPTGIAKPAGNMPTNNDKWYNLDGQQINQPSKKGLYIKNGRKIVIR